MDTPIPPFAHPAHPSAPARSTFVPGTFFARLSATSREPRGRATPMRWNLNAGHALRLFGVRRDGAVLAMTDWTGVGSGPLLAGLLLACWFGFLLWLLYFAATTPL
jgi:hypothetical protein